MGIVLGEVIAMGLLFNMTKEWSPYVAFFLVGCCGIVLSFLFLVLVKEPVLRDSKSKKKEKPVIEESTISIERPFEEVSTD